MSCYKAPIRCKGGTRCGSAIISPRWLLYRILLGYIVLPCYILAITSAEPFGGGSVGIHIPGASLGAISESRCPRVCSCNGLTVDCSHRGLTQVPRKISADVERL